MQLKEQTIFKPKKILISFTTILVFNFSPTFSLKVFMYYKCLIFQNFIKLYEFVYKLILNS